MLVVVLVVLFLGKEIMGGRGLVFEDFNFLGGYVYFV